MSIWCHICGGDGHYAVDCPLRDNGSDRYCLICGSDGHRSASCTRPEEVRKREVEHHREQPKMP